MWCHPVEWRSRHGLDCGATRLNGAVFVSLICGATLFSGAVFKNLICGATLLSYIVFMNMLCGATLKVKYQTLNVKR